MKDEMILLPIILSGFCNNRNILINTCMIIALNTINDSNKKPDQRK